MTGDRRKEKGSLALEALLTLPLMILCLVLLIQVAQHMKQDLVIKNRQSDSEKPVMTLQPAEWIRQTDLLLDWGRGLSSLLPWWS
jgi:hypothetical protein